MTSRKKKPTSTWDYRLLRVRKKSPVTGEFEHWYEVHEVFYRDGKPWLRTEDPVLVVGDDASPEEARAELAKVVGRILKGAERPLFRDSEIKRKAI